MIRRLNVSLALLLATLLTGEAQGEFLLFQREISVNRSPNIFDTNQLDLDFIFGDDFFNPSNKATLFDSLVISPTDVGNTYDATLASDPHFSTVATRLTDNSNQFIKVSLTEDQLNGLTEQRGWAENFFFGQVTPSGPPDLAGATIARVSLLIKDFAFSTGVSDESPAALVAQPLVIEQDFEVNFIVSIYAIPEPATWMLLAGLIPLGLAPFRRQR